MRDVSNVVHECLATKIKLTGMVCYHKFTVLCRNMMQIVATLLITLKWQLYLFMHFPIVFGLRN